MSLVHEVVSPEVLNHFLNLSGLYEFCCIIMSDLFNSIRRLMADESKMMPNIIIVRVIFPYDFKKLSKTAANCRGLSRKL